MFPGDMGVDHINSLMPEILTANLKWPINGTIPFMKPFMHIKDIWEVVSSKMKRVIDLKETEGMTIEQVQDWATKTLQEGDRFTVLPNCPPHRPSFPHEKLQATLPVTHQVLYAHVHQKQGVLAMLDCAYGINSRSPAVLLADDMGLGKTMQTYATFATIRHFRQSGASSRYGALSLEYTGMHLRQLSS